MKETLKSPSPDADQSPTSSVHLDHKTSLFHLSDSNTDSNELKASKGSGSSSDTQSFDEEDSQGAFVAKKASTPAVTIPPVKKKPGRKSAADKEADKSLSKILGTDGAGLPDKESMKVEVMLVDLAKKGGAGGGGTLGGKPGQMAAEKAKLLSEKSMGAATTTGRKTTGEKIGLPMMATGGGMTPKPEKGGKLLPTGTIENKAGAVVGKSPAIAVAGGGGVISSDPVGELRRKDPSHDPLDQSDVYEFKEPEPFEFEAAATTSRKVMNTPTGAPSTAPSTTTPPEEPLKSSGPGKAKKRILDLDVKSVSTVPALPTTPSKKVKRSPGKQGTAAALAAQQATPPEKMIKREEGGSSLSSSDPFDVLRKSPNFNIPSGSAGEGAILPEFTQKLMPSTEGFSSPVSSAAGGGVGNLGAMASGPKGGLAGLTSALKSVTGVGGAVGGGSSVISSAFVNTRNDDNDQWQSLRMFKSVVEGQIDMEDVLAKTKVPKEMVHHQSKGNNNSDFDSKSELRSSIADKFLKTLNHGGSSNSSSPSSSGEGPSTNLNSSKGAASLFARDFADRLEPKMGKKDHLKLDLLTSSGTVVVAGKAVGLAAGSPDKLDTMLELNPPKNNDLSETIQKLKSAINDDDDDEDDAGEDRDDESTDSERERLVIEDGEEDEDEEDEEEDEDDDEEEERVKSNANTPNIDRVNDVKQDLKGLLNEVTIEKNNKTGGESEVKSKNRHVELQTVPIIPASTEITLVSTADAAATTSATAAVAVAALASSHGLIPMKIKEELTISSVTLKEQSMSFATKFQESFYGSSSSLSTQLATPTTTTTTVTPTPVTGGIIGPGMTIKAETSSEMDLTCKESFDDDACEMVVDKKDVSITLVSTTGATGQGSVSSHHNKPALSNVVSVSMTAATTTTSASASVGSMVKEATMMMMEKDPESLSLLLCEETIPTSPWHRGLSEKSLLLEERKGGNTLESRLLSGVKSLGQTPNSSPRDSQSQDDSKSDSEDLKKTGEWGGNK